MSLDQSTTDGTGSEAANYPGATGADSGQSGVEVRWVSGSSCDSYRLEIEDPS
jgi:hypothetical protein